VSRRAAVMALTVLGLAWPGCVSGFGPRARYGVTFYCPGAGVDMGDIGVRKGLEEAGYRGQVIRMTWSLSFNPAIDQTVHILAEQGAKRLAGYIQEYEDEYPGREVNIVALSAGTGVAVWSLEALKPQYKVNNVVLLASSLSHDYDVSRALHRVKGRIYNYYSPNDAVLALPMKVAGTIDRKFFTEGAGEVGLDVPDGDEGRVVNIEWRPEFERYGYYGGHFDGTNPRFVSAEIAQHIIPPRVAEKPQTDVATELVTAPRDGPRD
jgi:hypothetical protein